MDALKKLFPNAFAATEKNSLIAALIIYVVVLLIGIVVGFVLTTILGWIPIVKDLLGLVLKIFGTIVDVYGIGGIILTLLVYFKVLK